MKTYSVDNLNISIETGHDTIQYTNVHADGSTALIGIYHPQSQSWQCPHTYPDASSSLAADSDQSLLRTILFLEGAHNVTACIKSLNMLNRKISTEHHTVHAA